MISDTESDEEWGQVSEVLPQVKWVSVIPIGDGKLRIDVWPIDKESKRDDLAIPLDESGTGIGQVLAVLYVAFRNEDPRMILVDEPQSFLHPGAARKLIEVLRRFHQHQYIVSTHSAGVIAAADAQEILVLMNAEGRTHIETVTTSDVSAMQSFLVMLGARLSDVFGMDRVLWVEGPTEERSIPLLLRKLGELEAGTSVVSIRNTGDLVGRDREKIFEIYNNVSAKASVLPREIAFILDSEDRDPAAKDGLVKLSKGRAFFLPRRMLENYLLHPDAICAVVNGIASFSDHVISRDEVGEFFRRAVNEKEYWKPFEIPKGGGLTSPEINGARMLSRFFEVSSECRVAFHKTKHSVEIFQWLLDNDYAALDELAQFMRDLLIKIASK